MSKRKRPYYMTQCNHCGSVVEMNKIARHKQPLFDESYKGYNPQEHYRGVDIIYELLECTDCSDIILRSYADIGGPPEPPSEYVVLYPSQPKPPVGLPPQVLREYEQAVEAQNDAGSYAVKIGCVLEVICQDLGAKKTSKLKNRFKDLAKRKLVPETLIFMVDTLTKFRHIGAHRGNDGIELTDKELPVLGDLVHSILFHTYSAPFIAKQAEERYDRLKSKSSKDDSDSKTPETS